MRPNTASIHNLQSSNQDNVALEAGEANLEIHPHKLSQMTLSQVVQTDEDGNFYTQGVAFYNSLVHSDSEEANQNWYLLRGVQEQLDSQTGSGNSKEIHILRRGLGAG